MKTENGGTNNVKINSVSEMWQWQNILYKKINFRFGLTLQNVYEIDITIKGLLKSGASKSLTRPDWKKKLKGRHFSSDAEVIAAAETWLDGQLSDFFFWVAFKS